MKTMHKEITNAEEKSKITETILRKLPNWFELEEGIVSYVAGVKNKPFFAIYKDSVVVGFIALEDHNEYSSEIYVMGVLPEYRGHGFGRMMIDFVWNRNAVLGKKFLIVKTLDELSSDKYYEETRGFYKKVGFIPLFSTTDIWGDDNPCVVMIKTS